MSSMVTIPSKEPHSSMTMAMRSRRSLRSWRTASTRLFSGTVSTSPMTSSVFTCTPRPPPSSTARITSLACTAPTILSRGAFLVDRVAGVLAGGYNPEELPQGHVRRQRDHVGAGDHDLARRRVLEAQDGIQHAILTRAKHPLLGRAVDDQAQLILRVLLLGLGGWGHPEEPNYGVGGAVEDDYAGVEEIVEKPHEGRHEQ